MKLTLAITLLFASTLFAQVPKCDGKSDDAPAFQAEINAAEQVGGVVKVPISMHGCVLAENLVINGKMRFTGKHYRQYTKSSIITFTGNGGGPCGEGQNGFLQVQSPGVSVEGIIFHIANPDAGTCLFNVSQVAKEVGTVSFDNNVLIGGSNSTNVGIWIDAADTVRISHSILEDFTNMVVHGGVHGLELIDMFNNTFSQCTDPSKFMIDLINGGEVDSVSFHSNVLEGSPTCNNGIRAGAADASSGVSIESNWFGDAGSKGTWISTAGAKISANTIKGPVLGYGLVVSGTASSTITNNTFQSNVFINGDAELFGNHFASTFGVQLQNSFILSHGNEFDKGSYNSYKCVVGSCKLVYWDTKDSSLGPTSNISIVGKL